MPRCPSSEILRWCAASNHDSISLPDNLQVAGSVEKHHRARLFVDGCLVRNLFNVNIEHLAGRKIYRLRMHQIAFEEHLDAVSLLGHRQNQSGPRS